MSSAFTALLDRQRGSEQRERLHRLRSEMQLQENDALWHFLALLEEHCAALRSAVPPSATSKASFAAPPSAAAAWPWLFLGLSAQTFFAAACVVVGAHFGTATSVWLSQPAAGSLGLAREILSLPAGWLMFVFAMPCAAFAVELGWRLRAGGERAWGWAVLTSAVAGSVACAFALWRLL